jgi:hypothetical protein
MSGPVVAQRVASPPASSGSAVQLEGPARINTLVGTLRLRAEPSPRRRIRWADDVIDNEGMGKKSSKGVFNCLLCFISCGLVEIAHHPRIPLLISIWFNSLLHIPQTPCRRGVFLGRRLGLVIIFRQ